jgi:hypothetical protein
MLPLCRLSRCFGGRSRPDVVRAYAADQVSGIPTRPYVDTILIRSDAPGE